MNRRILLAAVMVIVMIAVALVMLGRESPRGPSIILRDGTHATLVRVTTGNVHRHSSGNVFQRIAWKLLPDRWASKLGGFVMAHQTTASSHTFWLEYTLQPHQSFA